MPSYKKLKIKPNTGELETEGGFPQGIVESVNTPIISPTPTGFKPFKQTIKLEGGENISYVVVSSTGLLNNERQLVAGSGIQIVDNGPNSTVEIKLDPSFSQTHTEFFFNNNFVGSAPRLNLISNPGIVISANYNSVTNTVDYIFNVNVSSTGGTIILQDLGTGARVISLSGTNILEQKSIVGSGSIEITDTVNQITISASQGVVFVDVSGIDGISVTGNAITTSGQFIIGLEPTGVTQGTYNSVEVDSFGRVVSATTIPYLTKVDLSSLGTTGSLLLSLSGNNELIQKRIIGGGIIDVSDTTNEVKISADLGIILSSVSLGEKILVEISALEIQQRTLKAENGILLSADNDTLTFSFDSSVLPSNAITLSSNGPTVVTSIPILIDSSSFQIHHRHLEAGFGIILNSTPNDTVSIEFDSNVIPVLQTINLSDFESIVSALPAPNDHIINVKGLAGDGFVIVDFNLDPETAFIRGIINLTAVPTGERVVVEASADFIRQRTLKAESGILLSADNDTLTFYLDTSVLSSTNWIHANEGNNFANAPAASASNAIAIGNNAKALLSSSIAIGTNSRVSATNTILIGHNISTSADNSFIIGTNGKKIISINASGNVGIGVENPTAKLHVSSDNEDVGLLLQNSTTGSAANEGIFFGVLSGTSDFLINNQNGNNLIFKTNNEEKFIVNDKKIIQKFGNFSNENDAIEFTSILKATVTGSGNQVFFTFPDGSELTVPDNTAWLFDIRVIAKQRNQPEAAGYKFDGVVLKMTGNSTITMIGPPLENIIAESNNAIAWEASVTADPLTGKLRIFALVSSTPSADDIDWLAFVKIIQITN